MASKKQDEMALTKPGNSFNLPAEQSAAELPAEYAELVSDGDNATYFEQSQASFPFVSIRQKDLKNERGQIQYPAGGFKYQNVDFEVPDVVGEHGLTLSVLGDQNSRVYFKDLQDTKPTCKSIDGKRGMPGINGNNDCLACPLAQWGTSGDAMADRPKCSSQMNILCVDHSLIGSGNFTYILNLGRSGLKPWGAFKNALKRKRIVIAGKKYEYPISLARIRVTTEFKSTPKDHYIPKFEIIDEVDPKMFSEMKKFQADFGDVFKKAVEDVHVIDEEYQNGDTSGPIDTDFEDETPERQDKFEGDRPF